MTTSSHKPFHAIKDYILPLIFLSLSSSCLFLLMTNYALSMIFESFFLIVLSISLSVSVFSALFAIFLRYKNSHDAKVIQSLSTLYIYPILFWIPVAFLGSLLALNIWFYIVVIFATALITWYVSRKSKIISLVFAVATCLIILTSTIMNFEQAYCWKVGQDADPTSSQFVQATKEDTDLLKEFGVEEGSEIGVSFREHMRCHQNFELKEAVQKLF